MNIKKFILTIFFVILAIYLGKYCLSYYKKTTLVSTYHKILEYDKSSNYKAIYDFLTPEEKQKTSLEDYIDLQPIDKIVSRTTDIKDVKIIDNKGYITRHQITCFSEKCTEWDRGENTVIKLFYFINGKWYMPLDNSVLCTRDSFYSMPEEFNRAISLIIQRMKNDQNSQFKDMNNLLALNIDKVKKCLNIQYDPNNTMNKETEGEFHFSTNSTNEELKIVVSPKYQSSDDLLTAVLLVHEITHAVNYAMGISNTLSCYEDEAVAFTNELSFFGSLTSEERSSILSRYGKTQEADRVINFWYYLTKQATGLYGNSLNYNSVSNSSLKYVESSSYYQNQCKNNQN